jgi:hypothetical protein
VAECRSCKAPIVWGRTPSGKAMPLDAKTEKRALANARAKDGAPIVEIVTVYVPHWVTCPNAKDHRRD